VISGVLEGLIAVNSIGIHVWFLPTESGMEMSMVRLPVLAFGWGDLPLRWMTEGFQNQSPTPPNAGF
jgi:hypothetical protein